MTAAAIRTIDYSGKAWSKYLEIIGQPERATHYAKIAGAVTAEIARLIAMPDDSATRFKGKPGTVKRVAWSEPLPLDLVKAIGHITGASVNDVLLSCVAGALGSYLRELGDDPADVEIRALIPVNLRQPGNEQRLGNRFGLVALTLPLGIANPFARLDAVRARMEALKGSYQAPVTLGVLGVVGMAPKAIQTQLLDLLAKKATAVMTNVPGPQSPLYMAGGRLKQMMFWVPQSGDIGMGVSILSYNGGVQFGLVTDNSFVEDPQTIVDRFLPQFEQLLLAALMLPRDVVLDPSVIEQRLFSALAPDVERSKASSPRERQRRARSRVVSSPLTSIPAP
jgi:WS/DGAT/MGAT family acyltransferase